MLLKRGSLQDDLRHIETRSSDAVFRKQPYFDAVPDSLLCSTLVNEGRELNFSGAEARRTVWMTTAV